MESRQGRRSARGTGSPTAGGSCPYSLALSYNLCSSFAYHGPPRRKSRVAKLAVVHQRAVKNPPAVSSFRAPPPLPSIYEPVGSRTESPPCTRTSPVRAQAPLREKPQPNEPVETWLLSSLPVRVHVSPGCPDQTNALVRCEP